jgi:hypothetical protein
MKGFLLVFSAVAFVAANRVRSKVVIADLANIRTYVASMNTPAGMTVWLKKFTNSAGASNTTSLLSFAMLKSFYGEKAKAQAAK